MINFSELRKLKSLCEAVQAVTEAEKPLAKDEMSIEIDTEDTGGFTQIYSGLNKNKDIYGGQDVIYFSGPLTFIDIIRNYYYTKFKTVDQKETAIIKLETEGLTIEGDKYDAEEQAYVPGSLKITKKGKYKVYDFKIKSKFANTALLKNIKVDYGHGPSEAVQAVTEAAKPLAKDEMRLSVDDRDGLGFLDYGLFPQKGDGGNVTDGEVNSIMSDGPMAFLQSVILSSDYTKVDQMEKAIAKLEKEGLTNDDGGEEVLAQEQAYVPKSLKMKQEGDYKVYTFKIKSKFANKKILDNLYF